LQAAGWVSQILRLEFLAQADAAISDAYIDAVIDTVFGGLELKGR